MNQLATFASEVFAKLSDPALEANVFGGFLRDKISGDLERNDWDGDLDIIGDKCVIILALAEYYTITVDKTPNQSPQPATGWMIYKSFDQPPLHLHIKPKMEMVDLDVNSLIYTGKGISSILGDVTSVLASIARKEFREADHGRVRPQRKTRLIDRGWTEIQ